MRQSYNFINVIELKRKLYQRCGDCKRFTELDDMNIQFLRNDISYLKENNSGLDLYIKVLQFINTRKYPGYTFDEKMFCLIEACDPNLEFLNAYQEFGRPDKGTPEYQQYLEKARSLTGFADENLRKFENLYKQNIILKNERVKKLSRTNK